MTHKANLQKYEGNNLPIRLITPIRSSAIKIKNGTKKEFAKIVEIYCKEIQNVLLSGEPYVIKDSYNLTTTNDYSIRLFQKKISAQKIDQLTRKGIPAKEITQLILTPPLKLKIYSGSKYTRSKELKILINKNFNRIANDKAMEHKRNNYIKEI